MEKKRRITLQAKDREHEQASPQLRFQHKYKPSLIQIVNNKLFTSKKENFIKMKK